MGGRLSVGENVHVVIVGGGFGGIAAAKQLSYYSIPYTLIDIKFAFHHNMGALRASVQNGFAEKTFISYEVTFKDNFKQGKVSDIDLEDQDVILENGEVIHYSHLILATGSSGPFPGKLIEPVSRDTAIKMYEDLVQEIQKAETIVVVGGGLAGVELTAEIRTDYPDKEVTLIHSTYVLGDSEVLPSVRRGVKEILVNKGANLLLGQKVNNLTELVVNKAQKDIKVLTNKGQEITADMVICCTGIKINSSAYVNALITFIFFPELDVCDANLELNQKKMQVKSKQFVAELQGEISLGLGAANIRMLSGLDLTRVKEPAQFSNIHCAQVIHCTWVQAQDNLPPMFKEDKLTEHDAIIVDEYLKVKGMDAVFAVGDCANVNEHKSAYTAEFQALACVKNIIHSLKDEPMDLYKPGAPYMLVTMGRNDGVGQMCGCNVGKLIVTYVKSKDLLVKTSWKKMGQRMPH